MRVFPDDPAVVSTMSISVPSVNEDSFWREGVSGLLSVLRTFIGEGDPGTLVIRQSSNGVWRSNLTMFFSNTTNVSDIEHRMRKHIASTICRNCISYTLATKFETHISSELRNTADIYPNSHGILTGSSLVSENLFASPSGPSQMAEAFARLPMGPEDVIFTSNLGGQMSQNFVDTAIHPAWRDSAQMINFVRSVNPSIRGKLSALEELTTVQMPILYALGDPDTRVSYRNMGDSNEKNFQSVYWGASNYRRLMKIKSKWDVDDLFITRLGVGSEKWDREGMCRTGKSWRSRYLVGL